MKGEMLHIITAAPSPLSLCHYCEQFSEFEKPLPHAIVLIEQAVQLISMLGIIDIATIDDQLPVELKLYALKEDLQARGLDVKTSIKRDRSWYYSTIDYEGLVDLTADYSTIRTVSLV